MPVFTELCPTEPLVESAATTVCTCGGFTDADRDSISMVQTMMDSDDGYGSSSSSNSGIGFPLGSRLLSNVNLNELFKHDAFFVHMDGDRHWVHCELNIPTSSGTSTIKSQQSHLQIQQQRFILLHLQHQLKRQQCHRQKQRRHRRKESTDSLEGDADGNDEDNEEDDDDDDDDSILEIETKRAGSGTILKRQSLSRKYQREDAFSPKRWLPTKTGHLYAGSRFEGKQKSGSSSYDVLVDIKHVNLEESTLCGYLHIQGLTKEYPELTTFFDAEIIGDHYNFVTKKWDVTSTIDKDHWSKFEPFSPMVDTFAQEHFKYDSGDDDVIYMRWKEHFLVPDHRIEGISGASFAGFYYICYHRRQGLIEGFYYHKQSEKFQKLTLNHKVPLATISSYEFR
ncbi:hypothetical protein BGW38_006267 [Lunasporangiospora selenospora]|uniref:Vacuolar import and degradation protein n=1 Tax=Lunasporangiospora selenospora TaxID=979761 RepID=A0A9P6G3H9_9FUNG|nr:hypothetical protein BGW38_006267 [Lunasporangiospora selenospora]